MVTLPDPASDAHLAARLLAADPTLGGAVVRAPVGPARDAWLAAYAAAATGPVRRLPPGVADDRLIGGIDLAATLAAGRPVATRGLLAETAGGTLVVPMAERIDAALAGRLAAALDRGGLRVILLDEGEGDEAVPAAVAERCALWVALPVSVAMNDAIPPSHFWAGAGGWGSERQTSGVIPPPPSHLPEVGGGVPSDVITSGEETTSVVTDPIATLCATAFAFGIDSARAVLFAVRAARGIAALAGRDMSEDDLAAAARLVLMPRATRLPAAPEAADASPPEPPPPTDDDISDRDPVDPAIDALTEIVVAAVRAALPPDVLAALGQGRAQPGRGTGAGAARKVAVRGRPAPSRAGALRAGQRLALVDTLRAAAPWQRLRRAEGDQRVHVRRDDFRIRRFVARAEATTIFAVDASGSAAIARLAEAKGAVELLLAEAYVKRTQVALVAFRGTTAEVVLPPTRSLARAKRTLADLAGGGGTPLAAGLSVAHDLARAARQRGRTPFVVVLTDGRANIDAAGHANRAGAASDALTAARGFAADRVAAAFIDTSPRPRPEGSAIAAAMEARYLPLPAAGAAAMAGVVRAVTPEAPRR